MLKGQEFGKAIGEAIDLKLKSGGVESKAAIARHFQMKPPSLVDWVKKGAVAKDKLPELWRYFSDVVGPEHWGMSAAEWPRGISTEASPLKEPEYQRASEPQAPQYSGSKKLSKEAIAIAEFIDLLPPPARAEFRAAVVEAILKNRSRLPSENMKSVTEIINFLRVV